MVEDRSSDDSNRLVIVAVAAIIGLIGVSVFLEPKNIAVQNDRSSDDTSRQVDESEDNSENQPEEKSAANDDDDFTYTTQEGDSYTLLARQAVAATATNLSSAQRVAAETKLTQDAGAPDLAVGQLVVLDKSTVQAAIDWADSLGPADEAAWQVYVDNVVLPEIK